MTANELAEFARDCASRFNLVAIKFRVRDQGCGDEGSERCGEFTIFSTLCLDQFWRGPRVSGLHVGDFFRLWLSLEDQKPLDATRRLFGAPAARIDAAKMSERIFDGDGPLLIFAATKVEKLFPNL